MISTTRQGDNMIQFRSPRRHLAPLRTWSTVPAQHTPPSIAFKDMEGIDLLTIPMPQFRTFQSLANPPMISPRTKNRTELVPESDGPEHLPTFYAWKHSVLKTANMRFSGL